MSSANSPIFQISFRATHFLIVPEIWIYPKDVRPTLSSGCCFFLLSPWTEGSRGGVGMFLTFHRHFWKILASVKCFPSHSRCSFLPLLASIPCFYSLASKYFSLSTVFSSPQTLYVISPVPRFPKISHLHFPIWYFCLDFYRASQT